MPIPASQAPPPIAPAAQRLGARGSTVRRSATVTCLNAVHCAVVAGLFGWIGLGARAMKWSPLIQTGWRSITPKILAEMNGSTGRFLTRPHGAQVAGQTWLKVACKFCKCRRVWPPRWPDRRPSAGWTPWMTAAPRCRWLTMCLRPCSRPAKASGTSTVGSLFQPNATTRSGLLMSRVKQSSASTAPTMGLQDLLWMAMSRRSMGSTT